ncbi:hypothetical protein IU470_28970 [Nocardia abscessus]|uniref:Uncharacterized protein n=1 Tax=Nocardia abscessus TaxID=120957 RepID=A0ABS0CFK4_9NOCA|nr:hypothetical protein [Nocardia abscessus]MBF6229111.1 hypothetical protein [Nocardia abscessus]
MSAAYDVVPFSDLLHKPAVTAKLLDDVRALRLRRRDADDLALMRVTKMDAEGVVVDFTARLLAVWSVAWDRRPCGMSCLTLSHRRTRIGSIASRAVFGCGGRCSAGVSAADGRFALRFRELAQAAERNDAFAAQLHSCAVGGIHTGEAGRCEAAEVFAEGDGAVVRQRRALAVDEKSWVTAKLAHRQPLPGVGHETAEPLAVALTRRGYRFLQLDQAVESVEIVFDAGDTADLVCRADERDIGRQICCRPTIELGPVIWPEIY